MIQIKNVVTGEILNIKPTIFPDGTSQVWKLPMDWFKSNSYYKIIWYFEEEAELIRVLQLVDLLSTYKLAFSELFIPFLPYGRQDKWINNESTFALHTFKAILSEFIQRRAGIRISTLDAHSQFFFGAYNYYASDYIRQAIRDSNAEVIAFPDKGAALRYELPFLPYVILDKERDQQTGQILGMKFCDETIHVEIEGKRILIIDDICDGGATFIGAAKLLHEHEVDKVDLYVTHGIFSKGLKILYNNGINNIFTTKSLIKNDWGYELKEI